MSKAAVLILDEAEKAAKAAALAKNAQLPPEQSRGFDCGFAWVVVRPARGPIVTVARKLGKGHRRDYGGGGWEFPCSNFAPTQSIEVHVAAAEAFAGVLRSHGIEASTGSRLD
jgi:hypothetical protein